MAKPKALSLNEKEAASLLTFANEKRKAGLFNDITINVDNMQIPANKIVLSCYSEYFKAMFEIEMQERYENTVEIKDFDCKAIKMLIDYMYGETIFINTDNVMQVLIAADYLQMHGVKDHCIDFLQDGLTTDNCLEALTAYDFHRPTARLDHVYCFVSKNFREVFQHENLKKLSQTQLAALLANLNKQEVNHENIFAALIDWVEEDESNRKAFFAELFPAVDLHQLSSTFLEENVIRHQLVRGSNTCLNAVLDVFSEKFREEKSKEQSKKQQNAKESKIICMSANNRFVDTVVAEIHNIFGISECSYPSLNTYTKWQCTETLGSIIFCIGGLISQNCGSGNVYWMDVKRNNRHWEKARASMKVNRYLHAATVVNDEIVVSGGYSNDDSTALNSVELLKNGTSFFNSYWQILFPMNEKRSGHALVTLNNNVIALGGSGGGYSSSSSVESLSELRGTWSFLKPMNTPRNRLAAVVCDRKIYAIGGKSLTGIENSVEQFDFTSNSWSNVAKMSHERWGHSACVFQGRIFVVGGQNDQGESIKQIECFDPVTNQWSSPTFGQNVYQQNHPEFPWTGHSLVVL